jgi:NodT family efflux transporter outer membrane factor (OMF) lipoprotein
LTLQAELASDYFSLRGADSDYQLLRDSITAYERALDLTRHRYEGGVSAQVDVDQAETQLQSARAQMAQTRLQRAQLEHAIAVLLGRAPADFALAEGAFKADTPAINTGLPSALLQRRPDIASSERLVAAANAQIGVARAAWFPVFTLGASAGYASVTSSTLFHSNNETWALGPARVDLPVLDAGFRAALNSQARARYNEAVANYRKTVLTAYQEVEDNLAALRHLSDAVAAEDAAAAAAQRALFHSNERYSAGVADYVEVTSVQTAALQAQRAALDARVRRVNASVTLVRALGGGWATDAPGVLHLSRPSAP